MHCASGLAFSVASDVPPVPGVTGERDADQQRDARQMTWRKSRQSNSSGNCVGAALKYGEFDGLLWAGDREPAPFEMRKARAGRRGIE